METRKTQEFLDAYDAYADALYRHCFFRVFSKHRAEELVQETFLRAWQYLAGGKTVDNMRAFLYRVLNNLIIDESRKKKEKSLDTLLEESEAFEPASEDHEQIERRIAFKEVCETMHTLPAEAREILTLRYVDDLDPKEIADILGVNANVVSVRLHRATKALKEKLS